MRIARTRDPLTIKRLRWWRPRTVRRQLLFGVCSVMTLVLLAVGTLSVFSVRDYITSTSDAELARSLTTFSHIYSKLGPNRARVQGSPDPGISEELTEFIGQGPGNLIAVVRNGVVVESALFSDIGAEPAPANVVRVIEAQGWNDGPPRTFELPNLGPYRGQSRETDGGDRLVAAVSLTPAEQILIGKTIGTVGLIVVALVATGVGTVLVTRYALRPLGRVAATAAKVAALPLADDEHRITVRVGEADTDPDNEVGIVGDALNKLLVNVDSALAQRAASDRRIRQFLTDASHELRTPLAAIRGYAELTRQDSAELPPTSESALARIEAEAQRMSELVNDLLLISRLDEGQDLLADEVDLCDVVVTAVNDASVSGPQHHWLTAVPDEPVLIYGDRDRLHQLLSNLLTNARVHTPAGTTVKASIAVGADGFIDLSVVDNGPGIDPNLVPQLFERFVRADTSRSHEMGSTGLGLSIVASIAEAHHGSVSAESRSGQTVFRVKLPLIKSGTISHVTI